MGRALLADASINELKNRLEECEKKKQFLRNYLKKLHLNYTSGKITYATYIETGLKKRDDRDIKEWIEFYDKEIKKCENEIKKKTLKKNIPIVFISSIILIILVTMLFNIQPRFIGFAIKGVENEQTFVKEVALKITESSEYEFIPQAQGILSSLRVSGSFKSSDEKGSVKIYLDDILILNTLQKQKPGITGSAISSGGFFSNLGKKLTITGLSVDESDTGSESSLDSSSTESSPDSSDISSEESYSEEPPESSPEASAESDLAGESSQESYSEETSEETSQISEQEESPSQEQEMSPPTSETPQPEMQEEIEQTTEEEFSANETEQESTEEKPDEKPEQKPKPEPEILEISFTDFCDETCDLTKFDLNKSFYKIRIEIDGATLYLDKIAYSMIIAPLEEPKEIPANITRPEVNATGPEINITKPELQMNITKENKTLISGYPIHTKTIPNIFIQKNSFREINLNEYFSNAEQFFVLQIKDISTTTYDYTIRFQPNQEFTGIRETTIIAENVYGQIESNAFNIIVTEEAIEKLPEPEIAPEINITKPEQNITPILPEPNITISPEINMTIPKANITILPNITQIENITEINITSIENITQENLTITTEQYQAVLGQPVKWKKILDPEQKGIAKVKLPKEAENIEITKIKNQTQEDITQTSEITTITGGVIGGGNQESLMARLFKRLVGAITGAVIGAEEPLSEKPTNETTEQEKEVEIEIDDAESDYEIKYETPAPYAVEEEIERGKRITITGPETIHYENVLVFANLSENFNIKDTSRIKIKWLENESYIKPLLVNDTNNNGIYDYIEFIVPRLSNQTFEIIIEISKAEHLNSNREFISDIYEQVKALDNTWSETINNKEYIRVTFNQNLTSNKDITLYPRITSGNPKIEVYEVDGTNKIAEFSSLISNQYSTIYLTNLISESQDVFDLKIISGSLQINHIIDPDIERINATTASYGSTDISDTACGAGSLDVDDTTYCGNSMSIEGSEAGYVNSTHTYAIPSDATITSTWICSRFSLSGKLDDDAGDTVNIQVAENDSSGTGTWTYTSLDSCTSTGCTAWETEATRCYNVFSVINNIARASAVQISIRAYQADADANQNVAVDLNYVNITYTQPVDEEYPIFSNLRANPSNATTYSSTALYRFNSTIISTNGTVGIEFKAVNYTASNQTAGGNATEFNVSISDLSAGVHPYYWLSWGNGTAKKYNVTALQYYTIANASLSASTSSSAGFTLTYPTETIISISESNAGDNDVIYTLYRDNVSIGTGETVTLGAGSYHYLLNASGGQNYSYPSSGFLDSDLLVVSQVAGKVIVYVNNTLTNGTINSGQSILLNASLTTGDNSGNITLYNNGTSINIGTNASTISNLTTYADLGSFNITAYYSGSQNYTSDWADSADQLWVDVSAQLTSAPQIINLTVSEGPAITLNEAGNINVTINFTVEDANGVSNLKPLANVSFFKPSEDSRINTTCFRETAASGNNANFSCQVDLWWFDDDGEWVINATISDADGLRAENSTKNITVNPLTGFNLGPGNITFATLNPGSQNQTANNILILNNTGNQDFLNGSITINATTLWGETINTIGIYAGNFTVSNTSTGGNAQCDISGKWASRMNESMSSWRYVESANISRGNYTKNDGLSGQEQLYLCIYQIGAELTQQSYSINRAGSWTIQALNILSLIKEFVGLFETSLTIRILLVAVVVKKKKQKKKQQDKKQGLEIETKLKGDKLAKAITLLMEELKEKHKLKENEVAQFLEISQKENIPITIFNKNLGALEALTKYMKENLNMTYKEIADALERDQRTIWTSYKKAKEKQPEALEIKATQFYLPIEILKNRKFTILESVILYLREKQMKHKEIAKMLNRDARNIQTTYSRAIKKLANEK
ncbi:hypothetical protein J4225_01205 [Candidatus Pacearchaeota archaeon]|nr:hypothetical protein [Candidatus Pacearchaeota archaeon]